MRIGKTQIRLSERLVRAVTVVVVCCTVLAIVYLLFGMNSSKQGIVLEETPVSIEAVRPTGELYVLTCYTEEYVMKDSLNEPLGKLNTGYGFIDDVVNSASSLLDTRHRCIQMEKAQVSFYINLDSVVYDVDEERGIVNVTLPQVEFKLSPQGSPFLSDDKKFWKGYDTNILKREVKQKIEARFDTPENRQKALLYATNAIGQFVRMCGKEPVITNKYLERKRD